jgi:predicted methyltransferase
MPTATLPTSDGVILPDALYTIDNIKARLGLGIHALRMMRRAGLPVKYIGGRAFLKGSDLIQHIESNGKTTK